MSSRWSVRFGFAAAIALGAMWVASSALAQTAQTSMPSPVVLDQPSGFAAVRADFESLTPAELVQAGYQIEPVCISAAMAGLPKDFGNMGFHAIQPTLLKVQFGTGRPDPRQPPIVLLDAAQRVVGVEWESNQHAPAPVLFGQTVSLLPGHPGLEEPHYMLHAYFRPEGQVLFSVFDPQLTCPAPGVARDGSTLEAQSEPTRSLFSSVWGAEAAQHWAFEHNIDLSRSGH